MRVTVIPIILGVFETISKGFLVNGLEELEIEERAKPLQTTAFLIEL